MIAVGSPRQEPTLDRRLAEIEARVLELRAIVDALVADRKWLVSALAGLVVELEGCGR